MSFVVTFDQPFFTGSASASSTPWPYVASIGGHSYMVSTDPQANEKWGVRFQEVSQPLLRRQTDTSSEPGEQSLSPTQLWRRSIESWHWGAGQKRYDRKPSSPYRFDTSKGLDVWTEGQLSLLHDVTHRSVSSGTDPLLLVNTGVRLYTIFGSNIVYYTSLDASQNLVGSTTVTGLAGLVAQAACTDGLNTWIAAGSGGLLEVDDGSSTATSYSTGDTYWCGYAKGRLFASDGNGRLYNVTASGTALSGQTLVADFNLQAWTWTGCGEGPSSAYFTGYSGSKSYVYSVSVKADGTGLNPPVIAASLPVGELAYSVYGYLGYVLIGTNKGVRFANPDPSGNLTLGALIPTSGTVYSFDGQDRFVWFGWTGYDSVSSGLGRIDLSTFTADLTPAYATDLMYTSQGTVRNVTEWQGSRIFSVDGAAGSGVAIENPASFVTSGQITSGTIEYDIGDPKAAVYLNLSYEPLPAGSEIEAEVAADQAAYTYLGARTTTGDTGGDDPFVADQITGESFTIRVTLTSSGTPATPIVHRITLRAYPKATRVSEWAVPILLRDELVPDSGGQYSCDVAAEYQYLRNLWKTQEIVSFTIGSYSTLAAVTDMEWLPEKKTPDDLSWAGVFVAHLQEIAA